MKKSLYKAFALTTIVVLAKTSFASPPSSFNEVKLPPQLNRDDPQHTSVVEKNNFLKNGQLDASAYLTLSEATNLKELEAAFKDRSEALYNDYQISGQYVQKNPALRKNLSIEYRAIRHALTDSYKSLKAKLQANKKSSKKSVN